MLILGKVSFTDTSSFVNEGTACAGMFLSVCSEQLQFNLTTLQHFYCLQFFVQNIFTTRVDWPFQRFLTLSQGHADLAPWRTYMLKTPKGRGWSEIQQELRCASAATDGKGIMPCAAHISVPATPQDWPVFGTLLWTFSSLTIFTIWDTKIVPGI